MHPIFRVILLCLLFLACKNYFGNPYPTSQPTRTVPAVNVNLRVEPANWWTGMKHRQVEILLQYPDLAFYQVRLGETVGVNLLKVEKGDSPNYRFVTLEIAADAPAQKATLIFNRDSFFFSYEYPIRARDLKPKAQGLTSRDIIYLIFPDRFANGDPSNDQVAGMYEGLERDSVTGRHGGDLQGIQDHLDYIQDLGISAIWLTPELENNQQFTSYHGYALTDHYRVDRRLGSNEQLRGLVAECHRRGLKVIRDVVLNHIGNEHYWMQDLPMQDWIHQWPTYTRTSYRLPTVVDPYASDWDKKAFSDGWFDQRMPDLNQGNPHVANYLIQQAIWWIEYAGIDDLRLDTYAYSDQTFCSQWCRALRDEYPHLNMFGEIWGGSVTMQGFFADDQPMKRANFDSDLPSVIDLQLCFAIQEALTQEQSWTEGLSKVYHTLAQDYLYQAPDRNVILLDNHDLKRFYTTVGEDFNKYKNGLVLLLTLRGIPQIYYGTEILMTGSTQPNDGLVRQDFPGGWPGDAQNKFTATGRTALENEAFDFVRTIIQYRNETSALQTGKLMQFVPTDQGPEKGIYVYFRYDDAKTVMVVLNMASRDIVLNTNRFAERLQGFIYAKNVVTGELWMDLSTLTVGKNSPLVLELQR